MSTADDSAVQFDHVSKSFGSVPSLQDVTLSVERGRMMALLGLNGAGKSTAVDLMLGLRRPDRGQVRILGMDPRTAVRSRRVAALLQSGALPVGATVRETVDLSRRLYGRTRSLAQVMGLAGLDEIAGRRCEQLSGGQRQRVRFGMAIAGRTELLFLDEPSVALDIAAREHLWSTVRRIAAEGTTVVFATHYLPEAERHADTVVLLRQGRVAASGPPDQIGTTTRTLRFRHPGADRDWLATVAGVHSVDVDRDQVELVSSDADATLAALYHRYQRLTGVSMTGSDLEDALLCPPADSGSTPQEGCR